MSRSLININVNHNFFLKIYEPDEFDVMMTVRVDRVKLLPFSEDGAFYSVKMKRQSSRHPLEKFVNEERTIMASKMLDDFREKVKEAVKELQSKRYPVMTNYWW